MWRLHLLLLPVYAVMGFVWGALHLMVLIPLYLLTGRTPAWVRRDMRRLREKQLRYQERLGAGLPHRLEALGMWRMRRSDEAEDKPSNGNS